MKPLDPVRFALAVTALALYRAKTAVIAQFRGSSNRVGQTAVYGLASLALHHNRMLGVTRLWLPRSTAE